MRQKLRFLPKLKFSRFITIPCARPCNPGSNLLSLALGRLVMMNELSQLTRKLMFIPLNGNPWWTLVDQSHSLYVANHIRATVNAVQCGNTASTYPPIRFSSGTTLTHSRVESFLHPETEMPNHFLLPYLISLTVTAFTLLSLIVLFVPLPAKIGVWDFNGTLIEPVLPPWINTHTARFLVCAAESTRKEGLQ